MKISREVIAEEADAASFWREADGSVFASWFPGRGHSVTGKAARVGARTRG